MQINTKCGNVGIGTEDPIHPLEMASGAYVTSGGVWTDASSRDYKENIIELACDNALTTLQNLTPVTYNYKVDKERKPRWGLLPKMFQAWLLQVAEKV